MNRYTYYNSDLDAFELYHLEAEELLKPPSKPRIQPPDEYNAIIAGLSGAVGTSISNIAVYPIDLIVKRLQVQRAIRVASDNNGNDEKGEDGLYKDFVDAAKRIYKDEGGAKAFYEGCLQDAANSMGSAFIYFLSYNFMRQRRLRANTLPSGKTPKTLGVFEELSIGVLSGVIAKLFTAPIANIVTRKQTAALRRQGNKKSLENTDANTIIKQIYTEKGIRGFWSGYDATLLLTLNPAITFFLYEMLKSLLPKQYRKKPTGGQTFLLAAISKVVASSIMYPISMAKARSQVRRKDGASGKFPVLEALKEAYRAGGVMGMYEGVWGEISKGFFSNGITMLIKEALHRQILSLYILIIRLQQKNKTLSSVVTDASRTAHEAYQQNETIQNITTASQQKLDTAKDQIRGTTERADKVGETVTLKGIEQFDPEMPHIGDVSGEVGGIDWEDAIPGPSEELRNKILGILWGDKK
ncbi:uncharacterized protein DFL_004072 [Arthrobotrys flagrans]|uniref:Mitochondrial carrier protein n=1 Tax=Arthrobotrys flagrans TaxID=97331 RepID=A0A437A3P2_ARTFL|nr:hypothetical protein DFL_004072 [Arthrobotrys flagrans]